MFTSVISNVHLFFISVKMDRKQRTAAKKVRDLVNQIRNDESDIDDFESSCDEFKLRKCDLDELSSYSSNCVILILTLMILRLYISLKKT